MAPTRHDDSFISAAMDFILVFLYIRDVQRDDCENSAEIILSFPSASNKMTAHLMVSRVGHQEMEELIITGEKVVLTFDGDDIYIHFQPSGDRRALHYEVSEEAKSRLDVELMFQKFHRHVMSERGGRVPAYRNTYCSHRTQDLVVIKAMQAIYKHASEKAPTELNKSANHRQPKCKIDTRRTS